MISIIVPAYQTGSYISACIQSVLRQTWKNFELIVVDDGSTDQTREICGRFVKSDSRIRLLVQEHKGVSAARNAGMREAKGEYLFFLDSDDAIHPELLERLYSTLEDCQVAIASCHYERLSLNFEQTGERLDKNALGAKRYSYLNNQELINALIYEKDLNVWSAIGGKLLRRSQAEGIWFDEELSNAEDTKYIYELLAGGADAVLLPCRGYYYRKRSGSASQRKSIMAYKNFYVCDCYIRDKEMTYGRIENAMQYEWCITDKILLWYAECRMHKDKALKKYILKLGKAERFSALWKNLRVRTKLKYTMALYCYPMYEVCNSLWKRWF